MATEASERSKRRPSSHPQHRLDFPPPLRPPSSVPLSSLSFHAIGQKTSSSVASASLESEAARRRFGEGKADGCEGREGGGMGKFRGGGERQQKSKFLARQRGEQGDVVLVRWRRRAADKMRNRSIIRYIGLQLQKGESEGTRPIIENTKEEEKGEKKMILSLPILSASCLVGNPKGIQAKKHVTCARIGKIMCQLN